MLIQQCTEIPLVVLPTGGIALFFLLLVEQAEHCDEQLSDCKQQSDSGEDNHDDFIITHVYHLLRLLLLAISYGGLIRRKE